MTNPSLRDRLDAAPMGSAQIAAVAVTVALSALDGFDVLSVTFAAPAIVSDWGVGKAALGVVLSAGLFGMALGSLLLAPLADVFGRRRVVLLSLILMGTGMLLSAFAPSLAFLVGWRLLTGLGIGAMVAVINPLAAEFSNLRRRPLALSLMAMGYPAGGLVGGLAAALLLKLFGWPAVFLTGFIAALFLIPIVLILLPESPSFLASGRKRDSLTRLNSLLRRLGREPLEALPPQPVRGSAGYRGVFSGAQLPTTLRITLANLLFVMAVYYVLSWLPQMVVQTGFSPSTASLVASCANLAGILGGVTLGWLARAGRLKPLTIIAMVGLGLSTAAFGFIPPSITLLLATAAICGFFLFGGIAGLYATLAVSFRPEARASGAGFVIGVGRIGSAVAPLLAGWLFAAGFGQSAVSLAFGLAAVVAGLVLARQSRTAPSVDASHYQNLAGQD